MSINFGRVRNRNTEVAHSGDRPRAPNLYRRKYLPQRKSERSLEGDCGFTCTCESVKVGDIPFGDARTGAHTVFVFFTSDEIIESH